MNRRRLILLMKTAISIALIAVLVQRISGDDLWRTLRDPEWGWLCAAVLVFGLSALGGAVQWTWILDIPGISVSRREMIRLYFIGLFFNNFLLGNVGGDAVKIYDLGRRRQRTVGVLCGTLLDRVIGLSGLTLLAMLAFPAALLLDLSLPPFAPLLVAMAVWLAALVVLLSRRVNRLLRRLLAATPLNGLIERTADFRSEFEIYRRNRMRLARVGLLTLLVQALRIVTHVLVALGLGLAMDPGRVLQLFVLIPLLGILVALPISINGLGVREMAAAGLFVSVGVVAGEADAVAMEALAYVAMVLVSLGGGVLFLLGSRAARGNRDPD